jgi:ABC-type bacteriocin/lantibiotic exporter with double-glycine peptidase domain
LVFLPFHLFAFKSIDQANSYYIDVPFIKQEKNLCGAASLAMVLRYWGENISQYFIADRIYDKSKEGIESEALRSFAEEKGFLAFIYQGEIENIKDNIKKGRPLLVALGADALSGFHYLVIVGFDEHRSLIVVNDPYSEKLKEMDSEQFIKRWKESNNWTLLVLPKQ